jgi:hypothetical protein
MLRKLLVSALSWISVRAYQLGTLASSLADRFDPMLPSRDHTGCFPGLEERLATESGVPREVIAAFLKIDDGQLQDPYEDGDPNEEDNEVVEPVLAVESFDRPRVTYYGTNRLPTPCMCEKCDGRGFNPSWGRAVYPCDCAAGDAALFNVIGLSGVNGPLSGAEVRGLGIKKPDVDD